MREKKGDTGRGGPGYRSTQGHSWWLGGKDSVLPMQGGPGSIPGQGTRSHIAKLRPGTAK